MMDKRFFLCSPGSGAQEDLHGHPEARHCRDLQRLWSFHQEGTAQRRATGLGADQTQGNEVFSTLA